MAVRSITVSVPEEVYEQIEARARTADQSVDDVVALSLARMLPPPPEPDLPAMVQAELKAMADLSDEALWTIARSTANPDKVALYDLLTERQGAAPLTAEGQQWLTRLREEADALMLRKAHAYVLLQTRGYQLPSLDELHAQMS